VSKVLLRGERPVGRREEVELASADVIARIAGQGERRDLRLRTGAPRDCEEHEGKDRQREALPVRWRTVCHERSPLSWARAKAPRVFTGG